MKEEIRTEAAQFPEKEYINGILVAVCTVYTVRTVYMFNDYSTYWWINLLLASLYCKKGLSIFPPQIIPRQGEFG